MEYAEREHMMFMETSAQSAFNVEEAFTEVTKSMSLSILITYYYYCYY